MHWAEGRETSHTGCQFVAWTQVDMGGQYEYDVAFPNPQFPGWNSMKETFDEMIQLVYNS